MLEQIKSSVTLPIAIVLVGGMASFTVIAIWAPPGTREVLFGANGLVATLIAYYLRSPRDALPKAADAASDSTSTSTPPAPPAS